MLIDNNSITQKDGVKGVYIVDINGKYVFKPIKILCQNEKQSIVKSNFYYKDDKKVNTINIYDEVVRNISKVMK